MSKYGIKDLYQCILRTTIPLTIGNRTYAAGETLLFFDNIQEVAFQEDISSFDATGGWNNRPLIHWEYTRGVRGALNVGVINKVAYGILNAFPLKESTGVLIHQIENLPCDSGVIECKHHIDISMPVKVWDVQGGAAGKEFLDFNIADATIKLNNESENNVLVDYWYQYQDKVQTIEVGNKDLNGYLEFTGKFYYVDEYSGVRKTGLIKIPQMRIESGFSIRLGRNANPVISTLSFQAVPNGARGDGKALEILYLDEDIDAEI